MKTYSFDQLSEDAKRTAIYGEINFHIMTEDREDVFVRKTINELGSINSEEVENYFYNNYKDFFIDCLKENGDKFNEAGIINNEHREQTN